MQNYVGDIKETFSEQVINNFNVYYSHLFNNNVINLSLNNNNTSPNKEEIDSQRTITDTDSQTTITEYDSDATITDVDM